MHEQPGRYAQAAESFVTAAAAISVYAAVVDDAQTLTTYAGQLAEAGQAATRRWETAGTSPASGSDPGAGDRQTAEQMALRVGADLNAATAILVATLHEAELHASRRPSLFHQALADAWHYSTVVPADFGIGFGKGVWGIVDGAYQLGSLVEAETNPGVQLLEPAAEDRANTELRAVATEAWDHPATFGESMGETLVDWNEWTKNPAEAAGEVLPTVLLTVASAGAATAARASVAVTVVDESTATMVAAEGTTAPGVDAFSGTFAPPSPPNDSGANPMKYGPVGGGRSGGPIISLDQAVAAAERNGLDLFGVHLNYEGPDTPGYRASGFGYSSFTFDGDPYMNDAGKFEITLQNAGLASERDAVATIAHEWAHLFLVGPADHRAAEAFAQEVMERYIP
jgi:hypothetical protein